MVSMKRFFTLIFLVTFIVSAGLAFSADSKVIAYYFHSNARCLTCHNMEEYAKEAIKKNFAKELEDGRLVFKTVNVEEKENEHFVDDYQLYTKALIISQIKDEKENQHKNLTKIWEYVRNKDRFVEYVTNEIRDYLKE
ncbi:nitrophenyl compound nitroreductase subunit ArsF family protein [Candidatus Omnitrophota bacterium]